MDHPRAKILRNSRMMHAKSLNATHSAKSLESASMACAAQGAVADLFAASTMASMN